MRVTRTQSPRVPARPLSLSTISPRPPLPPGDGTVAPPSPSSRQPKPSHRPLCPLPQLCATRPPTPRQINRLNALSAERNRKLKEGEQVPTTLHEDQKAGNLHLPFTNIK